MLAMRLFGAHRGDALLSAGAAEARAALRLAGYAGRAVAWLGPLAVWFAVSVSPSWSGAATTLALAAAAAWASSSLLLEADVVSRGRAAALLALLVLPMARAAATSPPVLVVLAALGLLAAGALLLRGAMPMPPGRVAWLGRGGSICLDDGWADVRATEDTPRGEVFLVERPLAGDPYRGGARVGVFPRGDLLACDAGARVGLGVGILAVTLTPLLLRMATG
jgi:hypothetical protein